MVEILTQVSAHTFHFQEPVRKELNQFNERWNPNIGKSQYASSLKPVLMVYHLHPATMHKNITNQVAIYIYTLSYCVPLFIFGLVILCLGSLFVPSSNDLDFIICFQQETKFDSYRACTLVFSLSFKKNYIYQNQEP